jgi:hypothetical protein
LGHSGGQKDNLSGLWKELEDVVDLLGETTLEYLLAKAQSGGFLQNIQKASHRPHRERTSSWSRSSRNDAESCRGHGQEYRQRFEGPLGEPSCHRERWYHRYMRGTRRS